MSTDVAVEEVTKSVSITELRPPKMYNVIMHNDDVTTIEFVIMVLVEIFAKDHEEAMEIATYIHENGSHVVATTSREIAESKANTTIKLANLNNFPLRVTVEQE